MAHHVLSMRTADTKMVTMANTQSDDLTILNPATFPTGGPRSELVCPYCNTEHKNMGRHFAQADCGYPLLTQDEASALLGSWLVGGFVNPPEGRSGTPRLIIRAKSDDRLRLTEKFLGICGRHTFDMTTSDRQQLNTVPHPSLEELYDASRSETAFTRRMAQVVYTLRGETVSDECIRFTNVIDPEAFIKALDSVGMNGMEIKPKVVDLQGRDASAFRSWASTSTISSKLNSF